MRLAACFAVNADPESQFRVPLIHHWPDPMYPHRAHRFIALYDHHTVRYSRPRVCGDQRQVITIVR